MIWILRQNIFICRRIYIFCSERWERFVFDLVQIDLIFPQTEKGRIIFFICIVKFRTVNWVFENGFFFFFVMIESGMEKNRWLHSIGILIGLVFIYESVIFRELFQNLRWLSAIWIQSKQLIKIFIKNPEVVRRGKHQRCNELFIYFFRSLFLHFCIIDFNKKIHCEIFWFLYN